MSKPTEQSRLTAAMRLRYSLDDLRLNLHHEGLTDMQEWQTLELAVDRAVMELTA